MTQRRTKTRPVLSHESRPALSYREIAGEEADLIRRYKAGDPHAGGVLVQAHRPLIYKFTKPYFHQGVDTEDLLQEADLGFLYGVKKFDPMQGVRLTTYALYWVRARVARYLHDHCADVRVPVNVRDAYLGAIRQGAETPEEIAGSGRPQAKSAARAIGAIRKPVRIDAPLGHASGCEPSVTLADLLASDDASPEDKVVDADDNAEKHQAIEWSMITLTPKEREVITLRVIGDKHGETMTLQQVGDIYGVSRERIRQIEAKALGKIKKRLLRYETEALLAEQSVDEDELRQVEPPMSRSLPARSESATIGEEFMVARSRHRRLGDAAKVLASP